MHPVLVREAPLNTEAPLRALRSVYTPTNAFYVRSHFAIPALRRQSWRLRVEGAVERPLELTFDALKGLPARTVSATLECAGNDLIGLSPPPEGEPWGSGAVSTGVWHGPSLRDVLRGAGIGVRTMELLFEGADRGRLSGSGQELPFARSLPVRKALDPGTLLAYELNGEPLSPEHGGPVRLVVPGWYGVASVKWLVRARALERPFTGYFQTERYILDRPGRDGRVPIRTMRVKSLITYPTPGAVLRPGRHVIAGVAWSGEAPIARVEVGADDGQWGRASLVGQGERYAWRRWKLEWDVTRPGRHVLRARAADERGNVQPDVPEWNRLGYSNNAVRLVVVSVSSAASLR
jgi:DMSO/TMAO reductase YedYZ molybdopterin-dependent catalytic subunit